MHDSDRLRMLDAGVPQRDYDITVVTFAGPISIAPHDKQAKVAQRHPEGRE